MKYWLLKTEPSTYSWDDLLKDGQTNWDGVRNYQARNFLKDMKKGDKALIYHSVKEKQVLGVAKVVKEAYPDVDPKKKGEWVQVDLVPEKPLKTPVHLQDIKEASALKNILLVKQSRLSVMPVTTTEFKKINQMGGLK